MTGVGIAVGFRVGAVTDLGSALPVVDDRFWPLTTGKLFPHTRGSS